jgi:hypothetical protein
VVESSQVVVEVSDIESRFEENVEYKVGKTTSPRGLRASASDCTVKIFHACSGMSEASCFTQCVVRKASNQGSETKLRIFIDCLNPYMSRRYNRTQSPIKCKSFV